MPDCLISKLTNWAWGCSHCTLLLLNDQNGVTAITLAMIENHPAAVEILLQAGANVNANQV